MSLGSALEDARVTIENGRLVLTFSRAFNSETVLRSTDALRPFMTTHFGGAVTFESRIEKPAAPKNPEAAKTAAPARPAAPAAAPETFVEMKSDEMDADVQRALKHFPGVAKKERK
jgi:hypothetical protein